ncbi:MAG: SUMF1/EgtB/PvdO family nonheme iron enzyme [Planctomycetota bacterium]
MSARHEELDPEQLLRALRRWSESGTPNKEIARTTGLRAAAISRYLRGERKNLRQGTVRVLREKIPARFLRQRTPKGTRRRIFLSSTYADNAERREEILDAIQRAGCEPIAMEHWTSTERRVQDECLARLDEADAVVCILAWRYGWRPDGEERSITEIEFDEAVARGIPVFAFVIDESMDSVNIERDFDAGNERWAQQQRLDAFKAKVKDGQRTVVPFQGPKLGVKVMQALGDWQKRSGGAPSGVAPPLKPAEEWRVDYSAFLAQQHSHVHLAGFETKLRVPLRLEDLYVDLGVATGHQLDGGAERAMMGCEGENANLRRVNTDPVRLIDLARGRFTDPDSSRVVVLLGHPGSGKSTQLRRLALMAATQGPDRVVPARGGHVLLLRLRDLRGEHRTLRDFAVHSLNADGFGGAEEAVESLFDAPLLLLLDGLDEVAEHRRLTICRLIENEVAEGEGDVAAIVTCRFLGYHPFSRDVAIKGAEVHELKPLTADQRSTFVRNWYRCVELGLAADASSPPARERLIAEADERAARLMDRIQERRAQSRVYALASNPLLLTSICLVHRDKGALPEKRVVLYDECVKGLLQLWRESGSIEHRVAVDAESARLVLAPAAVWLHGKSGRTRAHEDEIAPEIKDAMEQALGDRDFDVRTFLSTIRDESGLLVGQSGDEYGFLHLTFQEYLAAEGWLTRLQETAVTPKRFQKALGALVKSFGDPWWDEVFCLLFAMRGSAPFFEPFFRALIEGGKLARHSDTARDLLGDSIVFRPKPFLDVIEASERSPEEIEVAREILRSHRPDLELPDGDSSLESAAPSLRFTREPRSGVELVDIPASAFQMGSPLDEEGRFDSEWEPHEVEIAAFRLARTPVTNEQYARFLDAHPELELPSKWDDERFNQPNQPVVGVSHDDAARFCDWAGLVLPTEAQWEHACRANVDGNPRYWSGDDEDDLARVGWYTGNSGGALHAVGEKPENPFGLFDMHGNVWEWCRDWYSTDRRAAKAHPKAAPEKWARRFGGGPIRVLRGGGFAVTARGARSAYRFGCAPATRDPDVGFRPAQVIP